MPTKWHQVNSLFLILLDLSVIVDCLYLRKLLVYVSSGMPSNEPSEISPLLPKPVQAVETGDTPAGPHPSGSEIVRHINDIAKSNDVEGQDGTENGKVATQYQGMPDVKKRLKYIVPAVAIGVGTQIVILQGNSAEDEVDLHVRWRSNYYYIKLWEDR